MGQQIVTASQLNLVISGLTTPPGGVTGVGVDNNGLVRAITSDGVIKSFGPQDMRSICAISAGKVLPAGFAEFWTDFTGEADHGVSFSLNATSVASVPAESGGKRRLTTQATGPGVAEVMPYYNQPSTNLQLPTMVNPKTSAWYVEGRAAIETHGATSLLFPCSIALTTGGNMVSPISSDTFCALGLVGTSYTGGSNSFLSFAASSSGVMLVQTTTIPWSSVMQSYSLQFDGAGTITATAIAPDGTAQTWTTTNLNQIFPTFAGFHPNQWVFCTDTTPTTMLVDYLYGAGPRI